MIFHSYSFICLFLPFMVAGWYLLWRLVGARGMRTEAGSLPLLFLLGMSAVFYGRFSVFFLGLLVADALIVYLLGAGMGRGRGPDRCLLAAGVLAQLGLLLYYKYYNFTAENLNLLFHTAIPLREVLLPIGISFYAFGLISFLADRYRTAQGSEREPLAQPAFLPYLCYVLYFPKVLQGPIMRCGPFIRQLRDPARHRFDRRRLQRGLLLFTIGLSKKVLLGDALGRVTDVGFLHTYFLDSLTAVLVLLSYTFQLYFDFSGYCDMAEGISCMLGIDLPANFRAPYQAASPRELWQRWHMTLSDFFIRYVYIPLGGSRRGRGRMLANVLVVFLLSGIWHGAGWTYLCWGLMQGLLVIWDDLGLVGVRDERSGHRPPRIVIPRALGVAWTFAMFVLSLIFFRSDDLSRALAYFRQLVRPAWPGYLFIIAREMELPENYILLQAAKLVAPGMADWIRVGTWVALLAISDLVLSKPCAYEIAERLCPLADGEEGRDAGGHRLAMAGYGILLAAGILSLGGVSSFLYFQY